MDSILTSIKKTQGVDSEDTAFDIDIKMHINTAFMRLNTLGVGPDEGFVVTGAEETWPSFTGDTKLLEGVKSYVYLKVRLLFDSNLTAAMLQSMDNQINELESMLKDQAKEVSQ